MVTLHDVTFLRIRTFGAVTTFGMGAVVGGAARRADVLITGTAAARDEICETLRLDARRFVVVHHGHGRAEVAEPVAAAEVVARASSRGLRVVLCVGAKRRIKIRNCSCARRPSSTRTS